MKRSILQPPVSKFIPKLLFDISSRSQSFKTFLENWPTIFSKLACFIIVHYFPFALIRPSLEKLVNLLQKLLIGSDLGFYSWVSIGVPLCLALSCSNIKV